MPEFIQLAPPDLARKVILDHFRPIFRIEKIETSRAANRITAEDIQAQQPLPDFTRSAVDGYAVRAIDTHGASETLPAYLRLMGEVRMGEKPNFKLEPGSCATIHTGGMLPPLTDAVVMIETTQKTNQGEIEFLKPVAVGENVIFAGEDVQAGEVIIPAGRCLHAADIGGLMALGIVEVAVNSLPRIGIISSGDEVVPPDKTPEVGQVRDVNGYSLSALVQKAGAIPVYYGIVPDDEFALPILARQALEECDMLVITAGSSASVRDLTAKVIDNLGPPGILVHGINIKPGRPTILGVCNEKPVVGLPGNPVSALVIAWLFVGPAVEKLRGNPAQLEGENFVIPQTIPARVTTNIASQAGREDWIPVRLSKDKIGNEIHAEPIFGKSNLIFTLSRADGMVRIPPSLTGLLAGEQVSVYVNLP